ncbi:hypothetical protein GCM10009813_18070 [Brevibacterium marinum]
MPDGRDERFANLGERFDIDAGGHAFAVQEVDEVGIADGVGHLDAVCAGVDEEPQHLDEVAGIRISI